MIIVKVPIENSSDSLGCRKAGDKIMENLPASYVSESGKEIEKANLRLEEIHLDNEKIEQANELIYKNSLKTIETNEKTIFLGGDQSMDYSIGKAFLEVTRKEDKDSFLIIFDAHPDCKEFKEFPTNTQWLRALINSGFPNNKVILIGLRSSSLEEREFLEKNNIQIYDMKSLNDYEEICDIVMELSRNDEIFLSIDIDVVDASFVPGTNKPESAGFTTRQLIYFIQRLNMLKNIRIVSISEINPDKDINLQTVKLGSKILGELIDSNI